MAPKTVRRYLVKALYSGSVFHDTASRLLRLTKMTSAFVLLRSSQLSSVMWYMHTLGSDQLDSAPLSSTRLRSARLGCRAAPWQRIVRARVSHSAGYSPAARQLLASTPTRRNMPRISLHSVAASRWQVKEHLRSPGCLPRRAAPRRAVGSTATAVGWGVGVGETRAYHPRNAFNVKLQGFTLRSPKQSSISDRIYIPDIGLEIHWKIELKSLRFCGNSLNFSQYSRTEFFQWCYIDRLNFHRISETLTDSNSESVLEFFSVVLSNKPHIFFQTSLTALLAHKKMVTLKWFSILTHHLPNCFKTVWYDWNSRFTWPRSS